MPKFMMLSDKNIRRDELANANATLIEHLVDVQQAPERKIKAENAAFGHFTSRQKLKPQH